MSTKRLIQILGVAFLITLLVMVTQDVLATAIARPSNDHAARQTAIKCASLPSRYSIHTEYVEGIGSVTYTEDGPAGVDGGLIELMSSYRTCSR